MITRRDVEYVADLARLKLSEAEIEAFTGQLTSVVEYVDHLDRADTEGIEPTAFLVPDHNPLREDVVQPSLDRDSVLRNAPESKKGFFAIPKVIGG